MLTVREAAPRLRVSQNTVYALCSARKLRHVRVGLGRGKVLIPEDAIDEFLRGHTVAAGGGAAPRPAVPGLKHLSVG